MRASPQACPPHAAAGGFCTERVGSHERRGRVSISSWKDASGTPEQEQEESSNVSFSTYASILRRCCSSRSLFLGRRAHALLIMRRLEHDRYLGNLLLLMYCNCDAFSDSFSIFCRGLHARNVYSWAIIIRLGIRHGYHDKALQLSQQMLAEGILPDAATLVTILSACAQTKKLGEVMKIHSGFLYGGSEGDTIVGTALLSTYSKCGELQMARKTFGNIHARNVVAWTAMIAVYSDYGHARHSLILLDEMQSLGVVPNEVTYLVLIDACTSDGLLAECKQLHASIEERCFQSHLQTNNSLITAYSKCGSLGDANSVLSKLVIKDVISWTSIISACAHCGACGEARQHFQQMQLEGFLPDRAAFVGIVDACAADGNLVEGMKAHVQVKCSALDTDVVTGTALINMYGRHGKVSLVERIFDTMPDRNSLTWNCIVAMHARHGEFKKAFFYFRKMEQDGMVPDVATFSSMLSACGHAGLAEEGFSLALKMHETYGIEPTVEHYNCLVGLLGRIGLVKDGKTMMRSIPMQPTAGSWATLLGACKAHLDLKQGESAAYHAFETSLEREDPFIVLSDLRIAAACPTV